MTVETQPASAGAASPDGLLTAGEGTGPLLQRDYWAVIEACRLTPVALVGAVAARFPEFAPADLVTFRPVATLAVGEVIDIHIRMAGDCRVRVVHRDDQSFTLATLPGHPEAGRITFGAYPNDDGDVIFHIRSRARSSSGANYLGFLTAGDPMQTNTWTDFVAAVALTFGSGVRGRVVTETETLGPDEDRDASCACTPTFAAVGG